ncbi:MAG: hypothetical protein ACREGJ_03665 [Candidatus Saccharimonadales bacterium]
MKRVFRKAIRFLHLPEGTEAFIKQHKLPFALGLVVFVAVGMTIISTTIYYVAGFAIFDLSRPGYERERDAVTRPEAQKKYDTTSPVTKETIDGFLREFDGRIHDLNSYGNFKDASLGDEGLQLTDTPPTQPAE